MVSIAYFSQSIVAELDNEHGYTGFHLSVDNDNNQNKNGIPLTSVPVKDSS